MKNSFPAWRGVFPAITTQMRRDGSLDLGREWTRAPRLPLRGVERKAVLKVIHDTLDTAPKVPKRK